MKKLEKFSKPEFLLKFAYYWSLGRMVITGTFLMFSPVPALTVITFFHPGVIAIYQHLWLISGAVSLYLLIKWVQSDRTYFGNRTNHDAWVFWAVVVTGINQGLHAFDAHYNVTIYEFVFGDIFFILLGAVYFYFAFQWWQCKARSKIFVVKEEEGKSD